MSISYLNFFYYQENKKYIQTVKRKRWRVTKEVCSILTVYMLYIVKAYNKTYIQ